MKTFEKVSLGLWPTPIVYLKNMSQVMGCQVYMKRDDLCGVALGGNKVRKLEYLLKDAMDKGYDLVMTTGQAQSNHAMLTAACCRKLGLECVLVLKKKGITERRGNQILNHLMGIEVRYVDTEDYEDIYREMDRIGEERGKKVYKIPCGGSNGLGSIGYVDGIREIKEQTDIEFDYVACACGSGGTAAGVLLGTSLYAPQTEVILAKVDSDPFEEIVPGIVKESAELLGIPMPKVSPIFVDAWGEGYSIPSEEGMNAITSMLQTEGIVLDTCYTGKAFGALMRMAKEGRFKPEEKILFIHTGGAGGLFAQHFEVDQ